MDTERHAADFARFWSKVNIGHPADCWEWQAATFRKRSGYGQFSYKLKPIQAQRAAWIFVHGDIPRGLCVLHKCDNPACVNPTHLFLGSRNDNVQDMICKSRAYHRGSPGERNAMAKLTQADVPTICKLHQQGISQRALATRFGVTQSTIGRIIGGKSWAHVTR